MCQRNIRIIKCAPDIIFFFFNFFFTHFATPRLDLTGCDCVERAASVIFKLPHCYKDHQEHQKLGRFDFSSSLWKHALGAALDLEPIVEHSPFLVPR